MDNKIPETEQALFNQGLAKLSRIDTQKQILQRARIMEDPNTVFYALVNIRNEIHERMTPHERKIGDSLECSAYNLLLQQRKGSDNTKVFLALSYFERYLADLEMKYGLSLPNKESAGDSISEME